VLPPNQLTALRLAANCAALEPLSSWALSQGPALLGALGAGALAAPRSAQGALGTLLLNLAVLVERSAGEAVPPGLPAQVAELAARLLPALALDDEETQYRCAPWRCCAARPCAALPAAVRG
jgi:hypothetical protein